MDMPEKNPKGVNGSETHRWLAVSFEFGTVIGFFVLLGYLVDSRFDTSPWFMLTGFFVGFTGMVYIVFKEAWRTKEFGQNHSLLQDKKSNEKSD